MARDGPKSTRSRTSFKYDKVNDDNLETFPGGETEDFDDLDLLADAKQND